MCYPDVFLCKNVNRGGKVRLVDGWRESEGVVEIYLDKSWGVMCGDEWEIGDSNVVCRRLGYKKALAVTRPSFTEREHDVLHALQKRKRVPGRLRETAQLHQGSGSDLQRERM